MIEKIMIGFFVGLLCGVIPMVLGFLTKHKIIGIVGIAVTIVFGILFSALNKSPFTAIGVAILFAIIIFLSNRNKHRIHEDEDDDFFSNDIE